MENETPAMDCMEDQNVLIDRLEDEFIDHPSINAGTNQFSDESFQQKLNERANQIYQGGDWASSDPSNPHPSKRSNTTSYQFLYTKPNLLYEYSDLGELAQELDQWFVTSDFGVIGLTALKKAQPLVPDLDIPLSVASIDLWQQSPWLDLLTYSALGEYGDVTKERTQLEMIASNCLLILRLKTFPIIAELLGRTLSEILAIGREIPAKSFSRRFSSNYLKLMTIFYFLVNVALKSGETFDRELGILNEVDLLTKIVQLCETWKIYPNPQIRIRNCLLLQWKLLLMELGGSQLISLTDEYLVKKFDVKNRDRKNKENKNLTCTPVEYFTFEEDFQDKYPMKKDSHDNLSPGVDSNDHNLSELTTLLLDLLSLAQEKEIFMAYKQYSNSLLNLIDIPRTNKLHSIYGALPGNTIHIATPVPSPPTTPSEFMSGGEKVRKLYHVNQGLPFVYPYEDSLKVPTAISEASRLFEEGVYESYLTKRLSRERDIYLLEERGGNIGNSKVIDNDFPPANSGKSVDAYESVLRSLNRTEIYYKRILRHLRGFVDVLVNVVKTSKVEVSLRDLEKELDPETSFTERFGGEDSTNKKIFGMIYHQLDVLRAKETTLKAVSSILILTLRWFKLSHPLKAYYFSSLLFDARFLDVFVDFLADSFNNSALQNFATENKGMPVYDILSSQNRLLNPAINLPQLSFFKECLGERALDDRKYILVNKTPIGKLPHKLDSTNKSIVDITDFNRDFCFILANLLNVTQKVLIKNILQRVLAFNEAKPTEWLKIILLNYVNEDLRKPILKIFKKITPYQGRKWRTLNMDVISLIYLHMKLSLKDNWLSGKDLENELKDSLDQEISLRSFLQFYNVKYYPHEMRSLGYDSKHDDVGEYNL
ncbi:hypothetical protein METBIDRAFT_32170 [Metschnikowia bicuspidata var. bicuspidata NRRL YB-4993]|uniref:N1221-domain-containing protein n=1 Tax=Metschnikowia bicuspidata var. bicuspidata NRRL YB-4993 TaxID=869754 RepID=A0A1A0HCI1_9ASCO|nr:hypothetical protein METBIDRAFT_32170 [Metschnikowia bicuspidata var. bicuspidata NRRL YB-4993]OBA21696.1 hypothetical protein METBIDRAFT_32170 [Metschnikowia bicuspidata var. bicuspidata NRRL YB-4993]